MGGTIAYRAANACNRGDRAGIYRCMRYLSPLLIVLLSAGCASTPEPEPESSAEPGPGPMVPAEGPAEVVEATTAPTPAPPPPAPGRVTLEAEVAILNETVREMGRQEAGGIVLMHGVGFETIPEVDWNREPFDDALEEILFKADLLAKRRPYYSFVFPPGYEALTNIDMTKLLPSDFSQASASVALGDGTFMSSALALLSHSTGITIVADNAVGAARTGELWLPTAPLPEVLDAILQSARVVMRDLIVEPSYPYVFLRTDRPQRETLLSPNLTNDQRAWLMERATVYLPQPPATPDRLPVAAEATTLEEALPQLSAQLGRRVTIDPTLRELPVSQCAFIDLPRGNILDLLIRQWLVPRFGYEVSDAGVVIRRR